MSTPGMPSTSSASTASTVAERRSSSNIASSPKMSPGPERGERDLAPVAVLAHRARVAGADDVARVGVVPLAEDDLAAAEAPRHGDVRDAHQVLGAQGLEDRYAAEQRRRLLCARGHVPRSIPDQAMSSARSRRRRPSQRRADRAPSAGEQRERQRRSRARSRAMPGRDLEHPHGVVAARRRASSGRRRRAPRRRRGRPRARPTRSRRRRGCSTRRTDAARATASSRLTVRSRALTASVSLSVVALASARSRPSRSRSRLAQALAGGHASRR